MPFSLGLTDEHVELAQSLRSWVARTGGIEAARATEGDPIASFGQVWESASAMGVATVGLPERYGGPRRSRGRGRRRGDAEHPVPVHPRGARPRCWARSPPSGCWACPGAKPSGQPDESGQVPPEASTELFFPQRSALARLARLARLGPTTSAGLARGEQVSPPSTGATLAALEELGLVDRRPDPADGRRVLMSLKGGR